MSLKIVSNNSLVKEKFDCVEFVDGSYIDVLIATRDLIHKGCSLVSHPLPASIRMVFSSIRSIVIEDGNGFDENSILIIEEAIDKYNLTMKNRNVDFKNVKDYEIVDLTLVESALEEYRMLSKLEK
ncbi:MULTISPECIES: GrdX family protein [unclassified Parvimonas]|uniref:GrdX family protein n=1 Tax=unclassified Parvimonas TaxID=1151464 RepID=UPI002B4935D4|nr:MULTISPECIES: GrdX family protein [unclassified Parvimonas]MEB3024413.1 GrdX family protein [Parvimonas sp. M13]MEB3072460.1 GrdX family protein [Parvimonas sp. C2]